jgi:ribosomal protein L40E
LYNFWTSIRKRSNLQRNKFRRKGLFSPFREIYLAVGSLSPKTSSKIVQSRAKRSDQVNFRKFFLVLGIFYAYTFSASANIHLENDLDVNFFLSSSKVVDNKIYLKPGTVYLDCDQILLNIEGQLLNVENLSADNGGIFITVEEILMAVKKNEETWTCSKCGRRNGMDVRYCPRCHTAWNE